MARQSVGVCGFKTLIRWLYPEAVAAFDGCAAEHDKAYKTVDWSWGSDATLAIDWQFRICCMVQAQGDPELEADAETFYEVARKWGRARARLWQWGVRW
jgi:hypothetical protein